MFHRMFGSSSPRSFWEQVDKQDPKLIALRQEMGDSNEWMDWTIPYILWGDGGRFTTKNENSMICICIKSLLAEPGLQQAVMPLWALPKSASVKATAKENSTYWLLWEHTVHALNDLFRGVGSGADAFGNDWGDSQEKALAGADICGGYRFVCWCLAADLEYLGNELHLPYHGSNHPCWMCSVARTESTAFSITDLSRQANWRKTILHPAEGIVVPLTIHPVAKLCAFTRYQCPGDLMHTGDLGVLQYVLAGVLCEVLESGRYSGVLKSRAQELWKDIVAIYEKFQTPNRLSLLTLSMFRPSGDDTACLKAKAAETRSLLSVVIELCSLVHDGSDHHEHRKRMLDSLAQIYNIF